MLWGEDKYFEDLKDKVNNSVAFDCQQYKDSYLKRRFAIRMRSNNVTSYRDYMKLLDYNQKEYEQLLDTLTVNVTEFMRDTQVYDAFSNVLRDLATTKKREGDKTIKIWSAGCSSGEEPYSIAILIKKVLGVMHSDVVTQIIATDIDDGSLDKARAGLYKQDALKNMKENEIRMYFTKEEDLYRVNNNLKRMIRFKKHDLIREREIGYCDVIFCRNVVIYFSREQQNELYMKFYKGLKDGGYFIAGKSETLVGESATLLKTINAREKLYQKNYSK
ncbi:MAG: chemotaxis methyltransferase CheR [Candidatus Syntrophoarchaeum sp. GoM_oil]|nr:MAG: chemotaxis methyltransferase CheR [Candidatus Syntrophoarchaeum sp. GoM_oil]